MSDELNKTEQETEQAVQPDMPEGMPEMPEGMPPMPEGFEGAPEGTPEPPAAEQTD